MIGGFYVKCVVACCAFFKVFSHLLLVRGGESGAVVQKDK